MHACKTRLVKKCSYYFVSGRIGLGRIAYFCVSYRIVSFRRIGVSGNPDMRTCMRAQQACIGITVKPHLHAPQLTEAPAALHKSKVLSAHSPLRAAAVLCDTRPELLSHDIMPMHAVASSGAAYPKSSWCMEQTLPKSLLMQRALAGPLPSTRTTGATSCSTR